MTPRRLRRALVAAMLLLSSSALAEDPFSQDACWDENCPEEVAACQANPVCKLIAGCVQSGSSVLNCYNEYGSQTAADLYTAIQECGWQACATNEGSCQGVCSYFGATVCNCDSLCEKYGDCCLDYWDVCWEEPPPCEPSCAGKTCGSDGCGGSCGECAINESCDATGQCNDQCPPVCELGDSGCNGDVRWTCTPGPGGCPKKTTVDCAGAQMICAHGECVAPPPEPDVSPEDVIEVEDVAVGPEVQDDVSSAEDTAAEAEEDPGTREPQVDIPSTQEDTGTALPQTQTAGSSTVKSGGCSGGPSSTVLESVLALLAVLWIRRRQEIPALEEF